MQTTENTPEESDAIKSEVNSELCSQDSETIIHKPVSSTSVDSDFQNGLVVNASCSVESFKEDKLSVTNTDSNKKNNHFTSKPDVK